MSNFQVTIISGNAETPKTSTDEKDEFAVRQQSRMGKDVVDNIESLEGVWDEVIGKLSTLASKATATTSQYELNEIEFNIGIEAGLSIGLVTKGNASVSLKFTKNT